MSNVKLSYHQECDFCHKLIETTKDGLPTVKLPGYGIGENGSRTLKILTANICESCLERLNQLVSRELQIEDIDYGYLSVKWKNDEYNILTPKVTRINDNDSH